MNQEFAPWPGSVKFRQRLRARQQRGMTLIEWMISITIGLILLVGMTTLIAQQSSSQAELEKSSRQIENGRFAMQLLQEDIQMAGYYGEYSKAPTLDLPGPLGLLALPDPCLTTAADVEAGLPFAIQGYDAPAGSTVCALTNANHVSGTDILVVRRVDPAIIDPLTAGQTYFQSGLTPSGLDFDYVIAQAASTSVNTTVFNLKKNDGTTAPLRKFVLHVYFISPCSVPTGSGATCTSTDDGGSPIPTLKRRELASSAGAAEFVTVPLVEGIENMQIDYGFDTTGDGSPDAYATTAAATADWAGKSPTTIAPTGAKDLSHWGNVMAVRINLLARNSERSAGFQDNKTYNMGLAGTTTATGDSFKRRMFSQLIRVTNPSIARDS
ncbi:MAG: PilW family protein [Rhodoferax sp.]|nr:PilW family protein [Rhodoferax sp.]MCF8212063.1 PilW family protein [Rhodoferax sp.]